MPDNLQAISIGLIIAVIIIWAVVLIPWRRKPRENASANVLRDWVATGRINMVAKQEENGDDVPTDFTMLIEENRLISDISGKGNVEIRWRKPTRHEARQIVRAYLSFMDKSLVPHERLQLSPFGRAPESFRHANDPAEAADYRPQPQPEGTQ